jgi:hypothetical protein
LSPQAFDRLGSSGRIAAVSLVTWSPDHLRRRQQFRCPRTGSRHHATCNPHQPTAVGREPVRTAREANIAHNGAAGAKGPALPKLKTLLSNPSTNWTRIVVSAWYGHANGKMLDITSDIALWYRPGTPVLPIRWVLVRDPDGKRDPQAFFSTDLAIEPAEIIAFYVRRWQIEVTFAETRAHLGVETQRQWSDNAIVRTTPVLLGLYSIVSLCACDLLTASSIPYAAAWYRKTTLTFSDAIAAVRTKIWLADINPRSPPNRESQYIQCHASYAWRRLSASPHNRTKPS